MVAAEREYFLTSIGHYQRERIVVSKAAFQILKPFSEVHAFLLSATIRACLNRLRMRLAHGFAVREDFFPKGHPSRELFIRYRAVHNAIQHVDGYLAAWSQFLLSL